MIQRLFPLLILLFPIITLSQNDNLAKVKRPIPLHFSFFNESTAIPFTRFINKPVHPGLQIGTEMNYRYKENSRIFQTINMSYFYHHHLTQGIGITTELGVEKRWRSGLAFSVLLGVGYLHTFATAEEFTFVNSHYEKKSDKGNARLIPSLSLDLGYYLKKSEKSSSKLFLRYQSWLEYPYSPDFIPVMTHINLHIGIKLFILRNK